MIKFKTFKKFFSFLFLLFIFGCEDKIKLPNAPPLQEVDPGYVQISEWKGGTYKGKSETFNQPKDITIGREPLIYIADTGNNRIVMLDEAGFIRGISKKINNPLSVSQDRAMNLFIINGTNKVFRINLTKYNHDLDIADIDTVFTDESDLPKYTAVATFSLKSQTDQVNLYYVTSQGTDTQTRYHRVLIGSVTSNKGFFQQWMGYGLELGRTNNPIGITTFEYDIDELNKNTSDFIFTQTGKNFKLQWMTLINVPGEGLQLRSKFNEPNVDINAPDKFDLPEDITVDESQNIYVIDAGKNKFFKFTKDGSEIFKIKNKEWILSFGSFGSGEKQFKNPQGIAYFAKNKSILVADTGNNRIVGFKLSTDLSTGQ
jgi:DNA-binding beta-propeller fold protein YncE